MVSKTANLTHYVRVMAVLGRTGTKGNVIQARVQLMHNTQRNLVRNIRGAVKVGDVLLLAETFIEQRRAQNKRRKNMS